MAPTQSSECHTEKKTDVGLMTFAEPKVASCCRIDTRFYKISRRMHISVEDMANVMYL
jgi:hypothetical protein